ncbi:hypothetical protein A3H10_03335 [Candidatus Uhrbacteria bacterium RIFCSPLOWO2_12_FULL_46_10]|uniref:HIT domain-containing protein n=1 Tax=Candidatus Uhrbacteria bacterium RIFCSPLOWO2_01_FULL_47_25 TaxID=1802402 RepID=A0A1F7UPN3_9BACT|nr:MAG: hypothetical protein A2752_00635 [Candidatus Uhrbacteria bacterium RIFCSPHIGHO2_01_FULL_46_23]OGL69197.1 MAG: hypothetical protein A3D60_04840 [Candidatus Uhrbacteria bacterium RIFCSPHIGHO2_02_FULL_47_29]OGL75302.1 MAG: hypothetical protein A3E96_01370 [Candidatus Uhrbacteria bacterium RIFCSPHIGHO2_12_FULL_46_13]OGL80260.1 MAG: hypothetical protein A2936_02745 [Candidatus Uhrbacteria bacterium RIFCSPLOWO2_01_FULL_47_25]OGL85335.1 MAG: hypothetical protein A3I37_00650 [Candidatus Uhrbact
MSDCIFCKIIAGEIPSEKVYEDEHVLAFLDIAPVNPGHTLVIPKTHSSDFLDTTESSLIVVVKVLPKIAKAIMWAVGADGFNIGVNNGAAAGQIVPHMHFHVIPRLSGDGYKSWGHRKYGEGEALKIAERIRTSVENSRTIN